MEGDGRGKVVGREGGGNLAYRKEGCRIVSEVVRSCSGSSG